VAAPDRTDVAGQVAALGTILGVWAHPDDETYLSGGLMATAADNGQRVVCVTATRGEAGSLDHERWPPATLADVRTRELDAALGILGVTEHHWFDYPDGGCADVPDDRAVDRIAVLLEGVRPDTVLTFAPDGMTGHPDHITVSRWATLAVERLGRGGPRLHYATVTPSFWAAEEEMFFAMGVSMGGQPVVTPDEQCSILVGLSGELLGRKAAAIRAQVSQTEALTTTVSAETFDALLCTEMYRPAQDVLGRRT
jgi:LmbE family N-acetylglucosaminyl deacetylase